MGDGVGPQTGESQSAAPMATSSLGPAAMGPLGALWVALALLRAAKAQTSKTSPTVVIPVLQSFQEDQVWGLGGRGRQPALC